MIRTILWLPVLLAVAAGAAADDVFVLEHGGRVVGQAVKNPLPPPGMYVIELSDGGRVTLPRAQIKEVRPQRPEEAEYAKIAPGYKITIEDQWALAEWCRQRSLNAERAKHLERILELDPDHEQARAGLGYFKDDGQWTTREEKLTRLGYIRHNGSWMLPQQIQLLEEKEKLSNAQKDWIQKVERWRQWLGTERGRIATESILEIRDPNAVRALAAALKDDQRDQARILYVTALANIGDTASRRVLTLWVMEDPVEEVCLTCLDYLKKANDHEAVEYLVGRLRSKDNREINRAALALGHLEARDAIGPLIDALITTHKFKIPKNPGQIGASFSNTGGGGLSAGGGPTTVTRDVPNRNVLDALVKITGQSYSFDVARWRIWFATQKKVQAKAGG